MRLSELKFVFKLKFVLLPFQLEVFLCILKLLFAFFFFICKALLQFLFFSFKHLLQVLDLLLSLILVFLKNLFVGFFCLFQFSLELLDSLCLGLVSLLSQRDQALLQTLV